MKEISPEISLEGLMLKLQLQYFGHLMRRADSFEKTLILCDPCHAARPSLPTCANSSGDTDGQLLGRIWGAEMELRKEATPLSSAFSQRPSSSLSFGPVGELRGLEDWVLCSAGLQSLHQGYPVALRQWQTSPIPVPVT